MNIVYFFDRLYFNNHFIINNQICVIDTNFFFPIYDLVLLLCG